ncbi:hypothetical protein ONA01_06350 [Mycoplasmopsis cynos]|nr:hypothetical protein [Mycoplasmopsis cynos]WAM04578.1 hypothetical protein ONA01_06350 [Mycoplasmopsis cynos]
MLRLPQRYLNTTDELKKAYEGQLDILNKFFYLSEISSWIN